jgi:hypothetical protein
MEERQLDLVKGKRQKGTKAPGPSEFQIQCAVADYLRRGVADGWLWNHFPAGELRTKETGGRLKRAGLQPGWFDLVLISPTGQHYWLELKQEKGRLSEEQATFSYEMLKRGVTCQVARGIDEAVRILVGWGALSTRIHLEGG